MKVKMKGNCIRAIRDHEGVLRNTVISQGSPNNIPGDIPKLLPLKWLRQDLALSILAVFLRSQKNRPISTPLSTAHSVATTALNLILAISLCVRIACKHHAAARMYVSLGQSPLSLDRETSEPQEFHLEELLKHLDDRKAHAPFRESPEFVSTP